jgi:hypothetical protein
MEPMAAGRKRFGPQIFTDETQIEKLSVPICVHLWPVFRIISA